MFIPGSPIWTVQRIWDVTDPCLFWKSKEHEYIYTATDTYGLMWKLEELSLATLGQLPLRDVFPRPVPGDLSDYETLRIYL